MKIKTNDNIQVIVGKDKGKTGKVVQTFPRINKVVVENVNLMKKHLRRQRAGEKGQVLELAAPMSAANVMIVCPRCNRATRVGYKVSGDDKKRFCKKCKEVID